VQKRAPNQKQLAVQSPTQARWRLMDDDASITATHHSRQGLFGIVVTSHAGPAAAQSTDRSSRAGAGAHPLVVVEKGSSSNKAAALAPARGQANPVVAS